MKVNEKNQTGDQSLPGRPYKHEQLYISSISTKKQGDFPMDPTLTRYTT